MVTNNKKNNTNIRTGFAVLFAILLASFLISLGISIFSVSLKEIMITTSIRDSQIAYYAADSARECAIYWDVKQGAFPACLDNGNPCTVSTTTNPTISCNGNPVTLNFTPGSLPFSYTASKINFFQATSTSSSTPAADISITKTFIPSGSIIVTTITALGHNTEIIGRRVERGIQQVTNQ